MDIINDTFIGNTLRILITKNHCFKRKSTMSHFKNVAVLMGGPITGIPKVREVSLLGGKAIAAGLSEAGFKVTEIDVTSEKFEIPQNIEAVFMELLGTFGGNGEIQARKTKVLYIGNQVLQ